MRLSPVRNNHLFFRKQGTASNVSKPLTTEIEKLYVDLDNYRNYYWDLATNSFTTLYLRTTSN